AAAATREMPSRRPTLVPVDKNRLFVRTAFATGCRWGELIAIRGTDVEARGAGYVLKVRRTVIEVRGERSERPYGKSQKAQRDITIPRRWRPNSWHSARSCAS
ncbi:MAG: hypothetical protein ACRDNS_25755, partial [Trebonia sp.]